MHTQRGFIIGLIGILWLPWASATPATAQIHHALDVTLQPDTATIEVRDTLTLAAGHPSSLSFALHPALQPRLQGDNARLIELPSLTAGKAATIDPSSGPSLRRYRLDLADGENRITLHYSGPVAHALRSRGEEYARSFAKTRGIISPQGVFLSAASAWYPLIDDTLVTFDLTVHLPDAWKSMSQGEARTPQPAATRGSAEHWHASTPQEEIYLIAGPFTAYTRVDDSIDTGVTAMVLLRNPDAALAQKYLDATHQYLALYNDLIGPYPFKKFAMVENFWETGYGMPSFTLLGSRVIRFPFILSSSYPHEILHNWWGNGVYVDYGTGNWAEGLTSYLADHLIKEQRGGGSDYRRNTLQKYTDYVSRQGDFPLADFRSRHSARTEAVGYGKTLMLFHMLRRQLGDAAFLQGLQSFYEHYLFRIAGFSDVQDSFAAIAGEPLDDFFRQWVQRTGAPQLGIDRARAQPEGDGYRLTAVIEQRQPGPAYRLNVPVAVHMDGIDQAFQTQVSVSDRQQTLSLALPARPVQLDVDPGFDVFRRLHRNEIPPAISQAMGAERVLVVVADQSPAELKQAYLALAKRWQQKKPEQVDIVFDSGLQQLPDDRAVWLFGWHNRWRPQLNSTLAAYDFVAGDDGVRIAGTSLTPQSHSLVVLGRQPQAPDQALGWLAADTAAALPGLGRKLPHYGRYSYLGFTGTEPDNVLKGQWPVVDSPMSVAVQQHDGAVITFNPASLAPRKALVAPPAGQFSVARMQQDVAFLADEDLAGRGLGTVQLDRTADYIAQQFRTAGLQPGGNSAGYFQAWQQQVDALDASVVLKNVIGVLPGSDPRYAGQSLVVAAHYDHMGRGEHNGRREDRGMIHPGADDNASGVAVMLELARSLKGQPLPRTLVFIALTGEETGLLGARHYVRHTDAWPADSIIAMLNLDTVGRLGKRPLTLFGTGTADEWVHIFRGAGYVTGVPVKTVADDFGSSDQTAFIEAGIPAVQFFSGSHEDFHRPGDTPEKLDYDGLTRVASVLNETVRYLGERPGPLHSTLAGRHHDVPPARSSRRISFGTVPDFTYSGTGVRLDEVRSGTPAEQGGLRPGDIIIAVNDTAVTGMRGYSEALKRLDPGDNIAVRYLRDGVEKLLHTQVTER